eukprot:gene36181-44631_t
MYGARGGSFASSTGGNGARVQATFLVSPGTTYYFNIGGQGSDTGTAGLTAYNGGGQSGDGSSPGGGGTDIRTSTTLASRIITAGGGGGSDGNLCGSGYNGGDAGQVGSDGVTSGSTGGCGATQSAGGAGGCGTSTDCGGAGSSGAGGIGWSGGGGGGYWGGGGGRCGGGGGSSYADPSTILPIYTSGVGTGDGYIVISYSYGTLYSTVGSQQSFTIPSGVAMMNVDMYGARGGGVSFVCPGGNGARVQASVAVTPGAVYYFNIGGHGSDTASSTGGYNFGGDGGAHGGQSGGGSTDLRTSAIVSTRIMVAGGGGGGGTLCGAGFPGGSSGQIGGNGLPSQGGYGASQSAPGANVCNTGNCGASGIGSIGGIGWGGSGGGGYFGGGGGFCGGGGGSSYVSPALFNATYTTGVGTGNGYLVISYVYGTKYTTTGAEQSFTVPTGMNSMTIDMFGARGGSSGAFSGGAGARVQARFSVVPATVYYFNIGGHGIDGNGGSLAGGENGGGGTGVGSGASGGGATDIRTVSGDLTSRIMVAGGGGGLGRLVATAQVKRLAEFNFVVVLFVAPLGRLEWAVWEQVVAAVLAIGVVEAEVAQLGEAVQVMSTLLWVRSSLTQLAPILWAMDH